MCRGGMSGGDRLDASGDDSVEFREVLFEIDLSVTLYLTLIWTLPVFAIELIHDVHAIRDLTERRETHTVQAGVIHEIDEDLRGAGVGTASGKGNRAARVALRDRVVLDVRVLPDARNLRIRVDAELYDEVRHDAEECGAIVEMMLDEIIEAIRSEWRPGARHFHGEIAPGGVKLDEIDLRRFGVERSRIQQ